MNAFFRLEGLHEPVLIIKPENENEAMLLAAFLRFDANVFTVGVERLENGHIEAVILRASEAQ